MSIKCSNCLEVIENVKYKTCLKCRLRKREDRLFSKQCTFCIITYKYMYHNCVHTNKHPNPDEIDKLIKIKREKEQNSFPDKLKFY